jgi:hypothetical protein
MESDTNGQPSDGIQASEAQQPEQHLQSPLMTTTVSTKTTATATTTNTNTHSQYTDNNVSIIETNGYENATNDSNRSEGEDSYDDEYEEGEESDDDNDLDEEPKLRYRRVGASVRELLDRDTASTLKVSEKFVVRVVVTIKTRIISSYLLSFLCRLSGRTGVLCMFWTLKATWSKASNVILRLSTISPSMRQMNTLPVLRTMVSLLFLSCIE